MGWFLLSSGDHVSVEEASSPEDAFHQSPFDDINIVIIYEVAVDENGDPIKYRSSDLQLEDD